MTSATKLLFMEQAWEDYQWFLTNDKQTVRRINRLIEDIKRNGYEGLGKPEPLQYDFKGYWSRRITSEHRIVYRIEDDTVHILQCRHHYGD
ncbi:Txe/YoeB family addiction module toxin [Nocardia sp. NPDC059764]|uniref:Txe/YoeB family addiction module toxin n=1 Tax=Nocardia sp. NPDC059764 TaxID=3346939 RepID=UPI00365D1284